VNQSCLSWRNGFIIVTKKKKLQIKILIKNNFIIYILWSNNKSKDNNNYNNNNRNNTYYGLDTLDSNSLILSNFSSRLIINLETIFQHVIAYIYKYTSINELIYYIDIWFIVKKKKKKKKKNNKKNNNIN